MHLSGDAPPGGRRGRWVSHDPAPSVQPRREEPHRVGGQARQASVMSDTPASPAASHKPGQYPTIRLVPKRTHRETTSGVTYSPPCCKRARRLGDYRPPQYDTSGAPVPPRATITPRPNSGNTPNDPPAGLPPYPNLRPLPLRIRRADNEERKRLTLCAATRRLSPASDLIGVGATCGLLEKEVGQFRCQTLAKASMAASRVVAADGEDAA